MTLLQGLLRKFGRPAPGPGVAIPALDPFDGPVYAVGDVHGCLSLYRDIEAAILADSAQFDRPATIVLLGDMVDRGPESAQVIDHLMRPLAGPVTRLCLMGNHEEMMLRYLADPRADDSWLHFGGFETLASYGLGSELESMSPRRLQQALSAHLPETHLQFLRDLRPGIRVGSYLLAHAGADASAPLAAQPLRSLIWGAEGRVPPDDLTLVHGHFITDSPDCRPHSIGIDTGAYATGRLTALRLACNRPPAVMTVRQDSTFQDLQLCGSSP